VLSLKKSDKERRSGGNISSCVAIYSTGTFISPSYCTPTDISKYRLLFGFSLLYTDRVPFELLDSAALL
jgi:hypothetical protein